MIFRAHKPNYMTGFEEPDHHFTTKEDLLEAPQVKRFAAHDKFHRFSWAKGYAFDKLMAEMEEGYVWWVCGHVTKDSIDRWFPEWKPRYTEFELAQMEAEEENRIWNLNNYKYVPPPKPHAETLEDLIRLQLED